jgi:restriction system protein
MNHITILKAIIEVMKLERKPLSVDEIYHLIIQKGLYVFKAKAPKSLISVELRRHCEGMNMKTARPNKYFRAYANGKYTLIES